MDRADMTSDDVRKCADMVQPGECITFPNGLVVDKRPVWGPSPFVPPAAQPPSEWTCPFCGGWVRLGTTHVCSGGTTAVPSYSPNIGGA